jgi:16S rRNA (uracil1498-N3)-methyltransferase
VAGPPVFLVPPGSLDGEIVTLSGPEGHHAAAVRRLRPGERADVSDGAGTIAECAVQSVARDSVTLSVRSVRKAPAPEPRITVVQALPKGDRGELAVELMTEVGVDSVIAWAADRCVARWQGERGTRALGKWRATAR